MTFEVKDCRREGTRIVLIYDYCGERRSAVLDSQGQGDPLEEALDVMYDSLLGLLAAVGAARVESCRPEKGLCE